MSNYYLLSWKHQVSSVQAFASHNSMHDYELIQFIEGMTKMPFDFKLKKVDETNSGIKINDDFVFCFSKNTVGYVDSIRQIPEFVSKYFVENVSTNFLLFDEEFWNADYVEMSRLVSKNLASTSAYFLEVELSFSGKKIGGINYTFNK
jgi:hypothetical protein